MFKFLKATKQKLNENQYRIAKKEILKVGIIKTLFSSQNSLDKKYKRIIILGITFNIKRKEV